ncbi:10329_t:CDS:10 [Cetraspora pellucida]|uniref:10329_t:CDS:1 n=1 Tax=Cetraspora pellucida TaxID=1433469 RepID=A0A9N9HQY8_9GLOM|nr:10329_t:CDS:10 [Cetraspora pellucida]
MGELVDDELSLSREAVDEELSLSEQIFSLCNSFGGYERVTGPDKKVTQRYHLGDECLGCLKDMKEILRYNDHTTLEVYCELWKLKILEKDLIPIIKLNQEPLDSTQSRLTLACVEIIVPMTWPFDLNADIDILDEEDIDLSQINRAKKKRVKSQYDYKVTFTQHPEILRILHSFLKSFILMERRERTQKDNMNIRLLLHLFRNLVAIKDLTDHKIPRTTLQNKLITLYEQEGIFKTLFNLASDNKELSLWNMIIQETFYHVFYDVEPQSLLKDPKKEAETRAKKLLEEEQVKKLKNQNKDTRYNGSVWIKVPPGKELTIHKRDGMQGNGPEVLDNLKKRKYQKTLPSDELDKKRGSYVIHDQEAYQCLKATAIQFFTKTFNGITRRFCQKKLRYNKLPSIAYEPGFEELKNLYYSFDLVRAIMDYEGFLLVFEKISFFRDHKRWSDLHFGLDCFRQMLLTLRAMKRFDDKPIRYKAECILNQIYYEEDNLRMMMLLVKEYKDQSFGYLQSLIATIHVLLERLESCSETTIVIEEISRTESGTSFRMEEEDPNTDDNYEDIEYDKKNREDFKSHKKRFEDYQESFVNESVISTYCSLLEYYERIDSESFYHITTAFHRIIVRCSAEAIFFKLSILELLNRISIYFEGLQSLTTSQSEFKDFIRLVSGSFFDYAEKNDLMYCEVFCPKTKHNWKCLQLGYNFFDDISLVGMDQSSGLDGNQPKTE